MNGLMFEKLYLGAYIFVYDFVWLHVMYRVSSVVSCVECRVVSCYKVLSIICN